MAARKFAHSATRRRGRNRRYGGTEFPARSLIILGFASIRCPSLTVHAGLTRFPQNSLLIRCLETKFADFGQNWSFWACVHETPCILPCSRKIGPRNPQRTP